MKIDREKTDRLNLNLIKFKDSTISKLKSEISEKQDQINLLVEKSSKSE